MSKLSILLLLLLGSVSVIAMEGPWKKEKKLVQQKVPTLKQICVQAVLKLTDGIATFPNSSLPELAAKIWEQCPEDIINQNSTLLIQQCLNNKYQSNVQAAMLKRLTLTKHDALTQLNSMLTKPQQEYIEDGTYLSACALFVKNESIQTWENGIRLASAGPITFEAAHAIIQTIGTMKNLYTLFKKNEFLFPNEMLKFHNNQCFEHALYELAIISKSLPCNKVTKMCQAPIIAQFHGTSPSICATTQHKTVPSYSWVKNKQAAVLYNEQEEEVLCLPPDVSCFAISSNEKWCCVYQPYPLPSVNIIDIPNNLIVAHLPYAEPIELQNSSDIETIFFDQDRLCLLGKNCNPVAMQLPWYYLNNDMNIREIATCLLCSNQLPLNKEELKSKEEYIHFVFNSLVSTHPDRAPKSIFKSEQKIEPENELRGNRDEAPARNRHEHCTLL